MFVYLQCLFQPKQDEVHQIQVISRTDDGLAFRCKDALPQGVSRVSTAAGESGLTFQVEVYHHDEGYDLYEGRILPGTQSVRSLVPNSESKEKSFVADLEEQFMHGALVRASVRLDPGSYLKMEFEGGSQEGEVHLAEVLWVTESGDSRYDLRLRYHKESRLLALPDLKHLAKVG